MNKKVQLQSADEKLILDNILHIAKLLQTDIYYMGMSKRMLRQYLIGCTMGSILTCWKKGNKTIIEPNVKERLKNHVNLVLDEFFKGVPE